MMEPYVAIIAVLSAIGSGLIGGVFFAFSNFVMNGLARLPFREGMAAMHSINETVLNPAFLGAFLGSGALCIIAITAAILHWSSHHSAFYFAGGILYAAGSLLVTIACNVPRNESLARVTPAESDAEEGWVNYVKEWTAWNHVRTFASLASSVCFSIGLTR